LRNDKIEQEQRLAGLEQELLQARQEVNQEHEKLTQERQRILRVFNRLRLRWQQKWSAEKEKHEQHAQRLHTEELALDTRTVKLQDREDALARQMLQFNTERELSSRELQDGRAALAGERRIWRRRRSHEYLVLKGMQRQADEAQLRLKNARRLLVDEKEAWDKQLETLQEELHGLNNRIVHQRLRIDEQAAEIDRLDTTLRQRRLEAGGSPESVPHALAVPEEPQAPVDWQRRLDGLEVLAGELADQRAQLLEQYRRLVQIQEDWTQERDHASTEMERLARRLLEQEQSLAERDQRMAQGEETLKRRQQECDGIREEMQVWRAQLNARSQQQAQEHRETLAVLGRKEAMLQEQLAQLTEIRDRWNQRRQQDIERLRVDRAAHDQLRKETHARHVAIFEATQKLEAEERILAEKTLALEQFQKDVLGRVDDPTARRRIERLRRRWLSLNATLIRNARAEHESARNELERLDAIHADLMKLNTEVPRIEATLAERQSALDELEASLNARQALLEEELAGLDSRRQHAENAPLRLQDEIDAMAHALFESPVDTAMDKAA
jgi:hypothetical protein